MNRTLAALALVAAAAPAPADDRPAKFEDVAKTLEASFEPADAKPGQTVLLKVKVVLAKGFATYPTFQPDRGARSYLTKFAFAPSDGVAFVGTLADPPGAAEKAEKDIGAERVLYYPGGTTFERKAVVNPAAKPGKLTAKVTITLQACDKESCFQKKAVLEPTLTVLDGPAVAVEKAYQEEVEKAFPK